MFLPEKSRVYIKAFAGAFRVQGKYKELEARVNFGELVWTVQPEFLKRGEITMWFGSQVIIPQPTNKVVLDESSFNKKKFTIDEAEFNCKLILGDIKIGAPAKLQKS